MKIFKKIKKFLLKLLIGRFNYSFLLMTLNEETSKHYYALSDYKNSLLYNPTKIVLHANLDLIDALGGDLFDGNLKYYYDNYCNKKKGRKK